MPTYRFICVRGSQKSDLIVKYDSVPDAKNDLHKQGYTIVEYEELDESTIVSSNVFFFETTVNGRRVIGQIEGTDAFKAYVKLTEKFGYTVEAIYQDKNTSEDEKRVNLAKFQEYYRLYKAQEKKVAPKNDTESKIRKPGEDRAIELDVNQFTLKEIRKYHALIDKTIAKIKNLTTQYADILSEEDRSRLSFQRDALLQAKSITNIDRLRIVGEEALMKIGVIEKNLIEKNKLVTEKSYIRETNELLKSFGSREKVLLDEDDIMKKFRTMASDAIEDITLFKKNKDFIDKTSTLYFKTLRELNIYRQKRKEIDKERLRLLLSRDTEKKEYLRIKRKLINQNIRLIRNRLTKRHFSYTKIVKGFRYYEDMTIALLSGMSNTIIYAFLIWSVVYVPYRTITYFGLVDFHFNPNSLFVLSFFSFLAFLARFIKNLVILGVATFLYIGFAIFLQVNF